MRRIWWTHTRTNEKARTLCCTCTEACNMCQHKLMVISSTYAKHERACGARKTTIRKSHNTDCFVTILLFPSLILRHSTCGGEAFCEAKQEEDGLTITVGLSLHFSVFNNGQLKKDQWVVPSVLVPCHQLTSQRPTVNSPSAPDGEPALHLCISVN